LQKFAAPPQNTLQGNVRGLADHFRLGVHDDTRSNQHETRCDWWQQNITPMRMKVPANFCTFLRHFKNKFILLAHLFYFILSSHVGGTSVDMLLAGRNGGVASATSRRLISSLNLFLAAGHVTPTAVRSFSPSVTHTDTHTHTHTHTRPIYASSSSS